MNTKIVSAFTCVLLTAIVLVVMGAQAQATNIGPEQYEEYAKNSIVIDVYPGDPRGLAHTDYHIPYTDIHAITQVIPTKDTQVLLYCKKGKSSANATQELLERGYTNIINLESGASGYKALKNMTCTG